MAEEGGGMNPAAQGRALVLAAALLALLVVGLGAYVRLSDAGLGCPDWPGCYGQPSPHHAADAIAAAHAAWPEGPVSPAKAWKEMVHRYLASLLGLAILAIAWRAWWRPAGLHRRVALLLAALVVCQGLLGMWTVTLALKPVVVSGHLLGGMATLSLLVWLAAAGSQSSGPPPHQGMGRAAAPERGPLLIRLALLAVILQIGLGGWVSSNYAAVACAGFPTCNGAWWPAADWLAAFRPDRELGLAANGGLLGLDGLVAIHWAHRLGALLAAAAVGGLAWRLLRVGHGRSAWLLLGLLGVQVGLGIANVLAGLPLAVAVAHNLGAALLLASLVWLHAKTRRAA
jgi:cytochrome c oxidase assembly protein subunit 15